MKRVTISNIFGQEFQGDFEDPTQWVSDGVAGNWWGLPQREKSQVDCTPAEIASAISSRTQIDAISGNIVTYYLIPAEYQLITTDLQPQIDADNAKKAQLQSFKQAVKTILQKADIDITTAEVKTALLKFLRSALLKGDLD
jgi:hypothetical protein